MNSGVIAVLVIVVALARLAFYVRVDARVCDPRIVRTWYVIESFVCGTGLGAVTTCSCFKDFVPQVYVHIYIIYMYHSHSAALNEV